MIQQNSKKILRIRMLVNTSPGQSYTQATIIGLKGVQKKKGEQEERDIETRG